MGIKEQNNIPGSCVVTSGSSVGAIVVGGSVVAAPTDAAWNKQMILIFTS